MDVTTPLTPTFEEVISQLSLQATPGRLAIPNPHLQGAQGLMHINDNYRRTMTSSLQNSLKKFRGTHHNKDQVLADMLQHRYVMLPCTFDSGGLLGPLFSAFLFGQNTPQHSILRISKSRPKQNLVNPQVEALSDRALSMLPHPGLFIMANSS